MKMIESDGDRLMVPLVSQPNNVEYANLSRSKFKQSDQSNQFNQYNQFEQSRQQFNPNNVSFNEFEFNNESIDESNLLKQCGIWETYQLKKKSIEENCKRMHVEKHGSSNELINECVDQFITMKNLYLRCCKHKFLKFAKIFINSPTFPTTQLASNGLIKINPQFHKININEKSSCTSTRLVTARNNACSKGVTFQKKTKLTNSTNPICERRVGRPRKIDNANPNRNIKSIDFSYNLQPSLEHDSNLNEHDLQSSSEYSESSNSNSDSCPEDDDDSDSSSHDSDDSSSTIQRKHRRKNAPRRQNYSAKQLQILNAWYSKHKPKPWKKAFLSNESKSELAQQTNLEEHQVSTWMVNKRSRDKKKYESSKHRKK